MEPQVQYAKTSDATALPIPVDPPVTIATRPLRSGAVRRGWG